jgi:hypothetical protein
MITIECKTIDDPGHAPDDAWKYYELRVGDLVMESGPFEGDDPLEAVYLLKELINKTEDELRAQASSSHW